MGACAVGGIDGKIEFYDFDTSSKCAELNPATNGEEISQVKFKPGSLNFWVGTERGRVIEYDIRYPLPLQTLTHHYRLPIRQIKFHKVSKKVLTCDRKIIKIWNEEDGSLFTNIEPKSDINDMELCGDGSGMIFAPQE